MDSTPTFDTQRSVSSTRTLLVLACLAGAIWGCGAAEETAADEVNSPTYNATIRWTTHGIPHIGGATLKDAIFGQGYAYARLNACTLADQIVKVNSQRARWFGAGPDNANIESDFTHRALGVRRWAEKAWAGGLSERSRQVITAYAAGYNRFLAHPGAAKIPERCRDAAWLKPLEPVDLLAYFAWLSLNASSGYPLLANLLGTTDGPPVDTVDAGLNDAAGASWLMAWPQAARRAMKLAPLMADRHAIGSNGWAIGKERSETGKGMVLANPHFPWFGELRLYETHLKTEDGFEATGVALQGVPGVLIGFSRHLAWTATVSASVKFIAYELKLKPGDPMTYLVDGKEHKITGIEEVIDILGEDGSLRQEKRTYYRSEVGAMLEVGLLGPIGEWSHERAFTLRDANANNLNLIDHFIGIAMAKDVAGAAKVFTEIQGNPWTNSMIADSAGRVLFSESNSVPNILQAAIDAHSAAVKKLGSLASIVWTQGGFYLMDGSTSANEWITEPGSREPGLVPWSKTPHLERDDYVANANESHWLTNPNAPLEGYLRVFGPERTTRGLRTRMGLKMLAEKSATGASGADGKFSLDELASVPFNNRTLGAELLLDGVLDMCGEVTSVTAGTEEIDIVPACAVLAGWDRTLGPDSEGAILWRELASGLPAISSSKSLYDVPFSLKDPANTPRGVASKAASKFAPALAQAIKRLGQAKIPLNGTLGQWQYTRIAGKKYPVHGGSGSYGAFNVMGWSSGRNSTMWPEFESAKSLGGGGLTTEGYPINYGSSFVMAMAFTDSGPRGRALLTYSQSAEPDSPYVADQTALLSQAKLRPMLFEDAEIDADPNLIKEAVSGQL